jgi:hypothetical protein
VTMNIDHRQSASSKIPERGRMDNTEVVTIFTCYNLRRSLN